MPQTTESTIYSKPQQSSNLSRIFTLYSGLALIVLFGAIYFTVIRGISILLLCSIIGALVILGVHIEFWIGSVREAIRVELSENGLVAHFRNGHAKLLSFQKIVKCQKNRFTYRPVLEVSSESEQIRIGLPLERSGAMIETLLDGAVGVQSVDLGNWPSNRNLWGKSADWDIINAAKERAAANRRIQNATWTASTGEASEKVSDEEESNSN
ncbi:MAG: hypothetical protein KDK33_10225 [Leptospiraceae bacterium]|nr:hypothetical protein [Leptospiraceae bacterium]